MIIAVVGNNAKFCQQLRELLESQSHRVAMLPDPATAIERFEQSPVDLVVLDGLPSKEATLEFIRALRSRDSTRHVPILGVNPAGSVSEVVEVLDSGADDYLAKPFNGHIFLARVRTLLRRQIWSGALQEEPVAVLESGGLRLHLVERVVRLGSQEASLTRLEFDLLAHLLRHKDQVLKRADILEAVWKYPEDVETRTLDKHVETLRRKLGQAGASIRTVHGIGYRFQEQDPSLSQPID